MHKIFGEKLPTNYVDRKGAYLIVIKGDKVAVVKTPRGYFLLGGGFESDESGEVCITRECMEEIGYNVRIEKQICSAETYTYHSRRGYFHPIQTYYCGKLLNKVIDFTDEKDHTLMWLDYKEAKTKMYAPMQAWAIEYYWNLLHKEN